MYIAPNSTVRVLRGVNIDSDYQHTVRFTNRDAQYDVLSAKTKFTFTPQTYQRTYKNSIKVEKIADDLFDCNYLMFQNTSYGNKWFYAFIDKVNYINDKCSEIEYTIDVMQSFLLDFEVGECFVEREHSITDEIGENTVSENFNLGEYFVNGQIAKMSDIVGSEMYGLIIFNKPIRNLYIDTSSGVNPPEKVCDLINIQQREGLSQYFYANTVGVPCTLTIVAGFCTGLMQAVDNAYYQQIHTDGTRVVSLDLVLAAIRDNLLFYQEGNDYKSISADDIVACYVYPKEFSLKSACINAQGRDFPVGYSVFSYVASSANMPTAFTTKDKNTAYAFSAVKNKKLLTAPYLRMKFYSQGNSKEYNFENFRGSSGHTTIGLKLPEFLIFGNKISGAEFNIQPVSYNGNNADNRMELIQFTENPVALYSENAYNAYMERNSNSHSMSILSAILGVASAGIVSAITANPVPLVGGAIAGATGLLGKVAQLQDLKNAPPPSNYASNLPLFSIGAKYVGGIFYSEGVTAESARIIDDYFSAYGYAVKRIKQPNIFAYFRNTSGYYLRPHWNYVKTNGAIIHPRTNYGLPAEAEKKIAQIIDNGITFWNDESEIGNYSLANDATGTP